MPSLEVEIRMAVPARRPDASGGLLRTFMSYEDHMFKYIWGGIVLLQQVVPACGARPETCRI
jgi:hypothetical protein